MPPLQEVELKILVLEEQTASFLESVPVISCIRAGNSEINRPGSTKICWKGSGTGRPTVFSHGKIPYIDAINR